MIEQGLFHKVAEYGSYAIAGLVGWFLKRHMEKSDVREQEIEKKLEVLDKRLDSHDVSRADYRAQLIVLHQSIDRIDKKLDKLLDR